MKRLVQYYRLLNILSIDIVIGAVVSALFFARVFHVTILPYGFAALALSVWIIYTADHLNDARKIVSPASSARHLFHQRHFKTLTVILILAVVADAFLIIFIRRQVFAWGVGLAVFVLCYLIVQQKFYFLKEFFVAILYTCGVVLLSISVTHEQLTLFHAGLVLQFGLLALINLLMFSWFDNDQDERDRQGSFVTRFGRAFTRKFIWTLSGIFIGISILQMMGSDFHVAAVILFFMIFPLLAIFTWWKFFSKQDYYRLSGDAIFFIPVLMLL